MKFSEVTDIEMNIRIFLEKRLAVFPECEHFVAEIQ